MKRSQLRAGGGDNESRGIVRDFIPYEGIVEGNGNSGDRFLAQESNYRSGRTRKKEREERRKGTRVGCVGLGRFELSDEEIEGM